MNGKDERIIQAILHGKDDKALQGLYDTGFRKIRDFVKKNTGSTEDAEDVFQDAVISFYKHVKEGKFDISFDIDAFLFTAGRNCWINKVKREQKIVGMPDNFQVESDHSLYGQLADKDRNEKVQAIFETIGSKCKELLTLVVYYDYSMKDVSIKMGLQNENAAKTQHYKCKQKLIELMGNNLGFKQLLKNAD